MTSSDLSCLTSYAYEIDRSAAYAECRAMSRKRKPRATPQIKVTIPKHFEPDLLAAMEYDGATKASQFALAAIMQRVRRIKLQMAADAKSAPPGSQLPK